MADNPFINPTFARKSQEDRDQLLGLDTSTWSGFKDSALGMNSASQAEIDARTLKPQELERLYGVDTARQYEQQQVNRMLAENLAGTNARSDLRAVSDVAVGLGQGIAGGVLDTLGLAASAATGFNANPVSEALYGASGAVNEFGTSIQSDYQAQRQAESDSELALRVRDNAANRLKSIHEGKSETVAELKEFGSNFVDLVASQNTGTIAANTASALGSTVVSIPIVGQGAKTINTLARVGRQAARDIPYAFNTAVASNRANRAIRTGEDTREAINRAVRAQKAVPETVLEGLPDNAFTRALGVVPGIAAMELGGTASEISQRIGELSHEELQETSSEYNRRLAAYLSSGESESNARKKAKQDVTSEAIKTGMANSLPFVLPAGALGSWVSRVTPKTVNAGTRATREALATGATRAEANAAGSIASKAAREPITFREIFKDIGSEAMEEAIQNPASQFGQNVAFQTHIDPKQTLREGLGEAMAAGILYSLGSTGVIQGVRASKDAVSRFKSAGGSVASNVATAKVVRDMNKAAKVAPVETPSNPSTQTPAPTTHAWSQINPEELAEAYTDKVKDVVGEETNAGKIAVKLNKAIIAADASDLDSQIEYGLALQKVLETSFNKVRANYLDGNPDVVLDTLSTEEANSLRSYSDKLAQLAQLSSVQNSIALSQAAVQEKLKNAVTISEQGVSINPESVPSLDQFLLLTDSNDFSDMTADNVIRHDALVGQYLDIPDLTDAQKLKLETHAVLLRTVNVEGLTDLSPDAQKVSGMILTQNNSTWAGSALQHIKGIRDSALAGNRVAVEEGMQDFRMFVQHMVNKSEALLNSFATGKDTEYASLTQKGRSWKDSRLNDFKYTKAFINPKSESSIKQGQRTLAETQILTTLFTASQEIFGTKEENFTPVVIPEALNRPAKEVVESRQVQVDSQVQAPTTQTPVPKRNKANGNSRTPDLSSNTSATVQNEQDTNPIEGRAASSESRSEAVIPKTARSGSKGTDTSQETVRTETAEATGNQGKETQRETKNQPSDDSGRRETVKETSHKDLEVPVKLEETSPKEGITPSVQESESPKLSQKDLAGLSLVKKPVEASVSPSKAIPETGKGVSSPQAKKPSQSLVEPNKYIGKPNPKYSNTRTNNKVYSQNDLVEVDGQERPSYALVKNAIRAGASFQLKNASTKLVNVVSMAYGYQDSGNGIWVPTQETISKLEKEGTTPLFSLAQENPVEDKTEVLKEPVESRDELLTEPVKKGTVSIFMKDALKFKEHKTPNPMIFGDQSLRSRLSEIFEIKDVNQVFLDSLDPIADGFLSLADTKDFLRDKKQLMLRTAFGSVGFSRTENPELWPAHKASFTYEGAEYPSIISAYRSLTDEGLDTDLMKSLIQSSATQNQDIYNLLVQGGMSTFEWTDSHESPWKDVYPDLLFQVKAGLIDLSTSPDLMTGKGANRANALRRADNRLLSLLSENGGSFPEWVEKTIHYAINQAYADPSLFSSSSIDILSDYDYAGGNFGEDKRFLYSSSTSDIAIQRIADNIKSWLDLDSNKEMSDSVGSGIYQAMAIEVLDYLVLTDALEHKNIKFIDNTSEQDNPSTLEFILFTRLDAVTPEDKFLSIEIDNVLRDAVKADRRDVPTVNELPKGTPRFINSNLKPNAYLKKAVFNVVRKSPFVLNTPMLSLIGTRSNEDIVDLFYPLPTDESLAHPKVLKAIESNRQDFMRGLEQLDMLKLQVKSSEDSIYFPVSLSATNRFMLTGGANPQNNKLLRELLASPPTTYDITNQDHMDGFKRAVVQAFGGKVAKMNPLMVDDAFLDVQLSYEAFTGNFLSQEAKTYFTNAGFEYSPLLVHALTALDAFDKSDGSFETSLYLELDGVNDGPFNRVLLFASSLSPNTKQLLELGGLTFSKEPLSQYDIMKDGRPDLYGLIADIVTRRVKETAKSDTILKLYRQIQRSIAGTSLSSDGVIEFDRGSFKDIVMIYGYGAGAESLVNTHIDKLTDQLYLDIHNSNLGDAEATNALLDWESFLRDLFKNRRYKLTPSTVLSRKELATLKEFYFDEFSAHITEALDEVFGEIGESTQALITLNQHVEKELVKKYKKDFASLVKQQMEEGIIIPGELPTTQGINELTSKYKDMGFILTNSGRSQVEILNWERIRSNNSNYNPAGSPLLSSNRVLQSKAINRSPVESGVAILPKLVQAYGDASMVALSAPQLGTAQFVHDGINIPAIDWEEASKTLNKSSTTIWKSNLYSDYLDAVRNAATALDIPNPIDTSKEASVVIARGIFEDSMNMRRDFIDEMDNSTVSIDHMGGAITPYVHNASNDVVMPVILDKPKVDNKATSIKSEDVSAFIATKVDRDTMRDVVSPILSILTESGTVPEIKIIKGNNPKVKGAFDRNNNIIYLNEGVYDSSTLVHELVHAGTHKAIVKDAISTKAQRKEYNQLKSLYEEFRNAADTSPTLANIRNNIDLASNGDSDKALLEFVAYSLSESPAEFKKVGTKGWLVIRGIVLDFLKKILGITSTKYNNLFDGIRFTAISLAAQADQTKKPVYGDRFLYQESHHLSELRDSLQQVAMESDRYLGEWKGMPLFQHESEAIMDLIDLKKVGFEFDPVEASIFQSIHTIYSAGKSLPGLTDNPIYSSLAQEFVSKMDQTSLTPEQKKYFNVLPFNKLQPVLVSLMSVNESFQDMLEGMRDVDFSFSSSPVLSLDSTPSEAGALVRADVLNKTDLEAHMHIGSILIATPKVSKWLKTQKGYVEQIPNVFVPASLVPVRDADFSNDFLNQPFTFNNTEYKDLGEAYASQDSPDIAYITHIVREYLAQHPEDLQELASTGYRPIKLSGEQELSDLLQRIRHANNINVLQDKLPEPKLKTYVERFVGSLRGMLRTPPRDVPTDIRKALESLTESLSNREGNLVNRALDAVEEKKDWAEGKVKKGIGLVSEYGERVGRKIRGNGTKRGRNIAGGSVEMLSKLLVKEKTDDLVEVSNRILNEVSVPQSVRDWVLPVLGKSDSQEPVLSLMKRHKTASQQVRQLYRQELPKKIAEMFKEEPSKEQWVAMTKGMMKTDIAAIDPENALRYLSDADARWARMNELEGQLSEAQRRKAEQLGRFMMTGIAGVHLLRNAHEIALLADGPIKTNRKDVRVKRADPALVQKIDELASLHALVYMDEDTHERMQELVENEPEAIRNMVNILKSLKDSAHAKKGKESGYKGYTPKSYKTGQTLQLVNEKDWALYEDSGWVRTDEMEELPVIRNDEGEAYSTGKFAYYYLPANEQARFASGIIQNIHQSVNGVSLEGGWSIGENAGVYTATSAKAYIQSLERRKPELFNRAETFIPVYAHSGELKGYEVIPDESKFRVLEPEEQMHLLIGVAKGRQVEEMVASEANNTTMEKLHAMFKKDHPSWYEDRKDDFMAVGKSYINLFDVKESGSKDPVLQEAVEMIPSELWDKAREMFGVDRFYVRRDMLTQALGYRKASIRDLFTGSTRLNKEYREATKAILSEVFGIRGSAYKRLVMAEKYLSEGVSVAKNMIVVKSGFVALANIVSNIVQMNMRGVSPTNAVKYSREAYKELREYLKNRTKGLELQSKMMALSNDDIKGRTYYARQIELLKDRNRRLRIYPLVESGEFTSIQDAGLMETHIDEIRTKGFIDALDQQIDKLPPKLQKAVRVLALDQTTAPYKFLQSAVQYGDFIAKGALLMHWQDKGKSQQEIVKRLNEEFVDYEMLPGRQRGALEEFGLLWFSNYWLGMNKVVLNIFQENPLSALLSFLPITQLGLDNPVRDTFFGKIYRGVLGYSFGPGMGIRAPSQHILGQLL